VPDQVRPLARRGTRFVGSVKSPALVEQSAAASWPERSRRPRLARGATAERSALERAVAAIVIAILIGDRAGLDDDMERSCRRQELPRDRDLAATSRSSPVAAWRAKVARISRLAPALAALLRWRAGLSAVDPPDEGPRWRSPLVARAGDHRTPPMNALAAGRLILCVRRSPSSIPAALTGATTASWSAAGALRRAHRAWWVRVRRRSCSPARPSSPCRIAAYAFLARHVRGPLLNFLAIPLMTLRRWRARRCCSPFAATLAAGAGYLAHLGAWGLVASARWVDLAPWLTWRVPAPAVR
jgi:hypothetical protein